MNVSRMTLRGGVRVQSGRAAVCLCMRPPMRDECSGESHSPVGCDGVAGQGAFFSMRVPCKRSEPLACLRGRLIAHARAVGCSLGYYMYTATRLLHAVYSFMVALPRVAFSLGFIQDKQA